MTDGARSATDPRGAHNADPAAQPTLFATVASECSAFGPRLRRAATSARRGARLRAVDRGQASLGRLDLQAAVADADPVRASWAVVERLEPGALYVPIEARDDRAGAPAIDPKLLLALWIYATSEGETSARAIARLTEVHASYAWLCGGVHVGYRTLFDLPADRGDVFDALLTQVLALLMRQGLAELSSVAQDGTRVRASAGAASFRRTETLTELMAQARTHLDAITRAAADPTRSARQVAARKRAAEDRLARLEAALAAVPDVTATNSAPPPGSAARSRRAGRPRPPIWLPWAPRWRGEVGRRCHAGAAGAARLRPASW